MRVVGTMSGTSMDGVDVVLMEINPDAPLDDFSLKGHVFLPYPPGFKQQLKAADLDLKSCEGDLKKADKTLTSVIETSTLFHQKAIETLLRTLHITHQEIDLIGYHGQTLYHNPKQKKSIVIGHPETLANHFDTPVIFDFRRHDVEMGGQGAPLAPLYHLAKTKQRPRPCVVVNCGGIANITLIQDENPHHLMACDTGPGNALIDWAVRQYTNDQAYMDENGQYGQQGIVSEPVLNALFNESILQNNQPYFSISGPKSLDINDLRWISALDALSIQDQCRTLAAFTAESIIRSVEAAQLILPTHWILTGGGWYNPVILDELTTRLAKRSPNPFVIQTADALGWHNQSIEAEIFALFAVLSQQGQPYSFPNTTGVPFPMTGGEAFLPQRLKT